MSWLNSYSAQAELTDKLQKRKDHVSLLAAGLLGETGSIVAEIKKMYREAEAYPGYRQRLKEEIGDFLWYYIRLVSLCSSGLLGTLSTRQPKAVFRLPDIRPALELGSAVGRVVRLIRESRSSVELQAELSSVWNQLITIAGRAGIKLEEASQVNIAKIQSRWPKKKK